MLPSGILTATIAVVASVSMVVAIASVSLLGAGVARVASAACILSNVTAGIGIGITLSLLGIIAAAVVTDNGGRLSSILNSRLVIGLGGSGGIGRSSRIASCSKGVVALAVLIVFIVVLIISVSSIGSLLGASV